jgi:DNA polymerase-3 subunit delta'
LLHADRTARFKLAEKLAYQKKGPGARDTLILWLGWWRDVMLAAGGGERNLPFTNIDRLSAIRAAATRHGLVAAAGAARSIQTALQQLDCNANQRLALEVLLLDLPGLR